jgi:hypothetical protein
MPRPTKCRRPHVITTTTRPSVHCALAPFRNTPRELPEAAREVHWALNDPHAIWAHGHETPPQREGSPISRLVRHTQSRGRASHYIPDTNPPKLPARRGRVPARPDISTTATKQKSRQGSQLPLSCSSGVSAVAIRPTCPAVPARTSIP